MLNYGLVMDNNRFAGILGDDYNLLKFAYPHHDEFQEKIGLEIQAYAKSRKLDEPIILEGGCGSGITSLFILKRNPQAKLVGVDNERKMLDQAKDILEKYLGQVELVHQDLLEYLKSQSSESVDIFVVVWTLHNLQPKYRDAVFQEVTRILKPKGLFISGDMYAPENVEQHTKELEAQLDRFKQYSNKELAAAWVAHNLEDDKIKIRESEQIAILQDLGFTNVRIAYRKDMEAIIEGIKG